MEQPNPSPPALPEHEIEQLKAEIRDLQARVAALENGAIVSPPPVPAIASREQTESRFGLTVINRIGAVTLAIGIIFFFKYAAENQWIGAGGLVGAGVLIGALLVGVGEWLRTRNQEAFAQGVAGCGFAIMYISVYAAVGYYKLLPRAAGFSGLLLVSALAITLSFRFVSPAIAAVGFIGGWIAPLLVRNHDASQSWLEWIYLFLLSIVCTWASGFLYSRDLKTPSLVLLPFNAGWALLSGWILLDDAHPGAFALLAFAVAAVHFCFALLERIRGPLYSLFYVAGHCCLLVALLRSIGLWASTNIAAAERAGFLSEASSLLFGVYGLLTLAAGVIGRSTLNRTLALALLGIVVVKLYLYDVWLLTRFYRISALVLLGVLLLVASYLYSRFKQRAASSHNN